MPREIERKFLLTSEGWRAQAERRQRMTQGYIAASERMSVRVRIAGDDAWLNIKSGGLVASRLEYEYSPIRHAEKIGCPVSVAWAEKEAAEFHRQSSEFAKRLGAPTIVGKGLNHFEACLTLADPHAPLGQAALDMLR